MSFVLYVTVCNLEFTFKVVDNSGVQIGEVKKLWGGLLTEMFTDADTFLVTFPVNLDVRIKALMVGACFLLVRRQIYLCLTLYKNNLNLGFHVFRR